MILLWERPPGRDSRVQEHSPTKDFMCARHHLFNFSRLSGFPGSRRYHILANHKNNHFQISRRKFLRDASLGAVGIAVSAGVLGANVERSSAQAAKTKVIEVSNENVWEDDTLNAEIVKNMIDSGMQELTKRKSAEDAWKDFVVPDDVVGIKVNPLAGPKLSTSRVVVDGIIAGLISAGVPENNIIIWDRFEEHLVRAGCEINVSETGVRCYATDGQGPGYDENVFYETDEDSANRRDENGLRSLFSKIVTRQVTKLINAPVLKQHSVSGVSLCLKNLAFGSVNNTIRFHPKPINCNPMIAEICAESALKDKLVLNILDGLRGGFDGGPGYKSDGMWKYNSLLFSTDPVALDRVGLEVIDTKRKEVKLEAMSSLAKHISTAWRLGLGTNDLRNDIDWKKITV